MNQISNLKSDIQNNFEGVISFDENSIIKRAFSKMSMRLNSPTLKREINLYSGIFLDNETDFFVPEKPHKNGRVWNSVEDTKYNLKPLNHLTQRYDLENNASVIDLTDHSRVKVFPEIEKTFNLIDNFSDIDTFDLGVNKAELIEGTKKINNGKSILATFKKSLKEISKNISIESEDVLSDDVAVIPIEFTELNAESITLTLASSTGSRIIKYNVENLQKGWNQLEFNIKDAVIDGVVSGITSFSLEIIPSENTEQKVTFGRAVLHRAPEFKFVYYSDRFIIDSVTNSPVDTPQRDDDTVNLNADEYEIMILEASILAGYKVTKRENMSKDKREFKSDLIEAYREYQGDSDREPVSYNNNPANEYFNSGNSINNIDNNNCK